mmetsp:Transcript_2760/g.4644  ORF Transcript_2760/g.4644 Transcript_2760/m.4644 type:complete len:209 (+) Transcript_2760:401-1027(+)
MGLRPCWFTASPLATTTAPAPSLIPEALPAVTTPPFLKRGLSLARLSKVVWGRGCSSVSKATSPFLRSLIMIGSISSLKRPSSLALPHNCWLRKASSSDCSLVMSYFSAKFSAVIAIGQPACLSLSVSQSVSIMGGFTPSGDPQRTYEEYGASDMDSAPPVSTTWLSPSMMSWQPETMLWKPDPHRRLTVSAGAESFTPALSPTWRAR